MNQWAVEVARGGAAELAAILGPAFCDNPGMVAALGADRPRRLARATRLMRGLAETALRGGHVEVVRAGGRVVGASLSYAPGQVPRGLTQAPVVLAALSAGPRSVLRLLRLESFLHRHHPRAPHLFLAVLGVDPALQGRQVGSALLRSLSARADEARLPCYLETDGERNVRLYERHGYAVLSTHALAELDGTRFWLMQRPAVRA